MAIPNSTKDKPKEIVSKSNESIIILSDVHLGYVKKSKERFESFLDEILKATNENDEFWCNKLILAGDIFELWRRDFDYVLNQAQTVLKLLAQIQERDNLEVYILTGNHDYCLGTEQKKIPDFEVYRWCKLTMEGISKPIHIVHGDIFDLIQNESLSKQWCENQKSSEIKDNLWSRLPIIIRAFTASLGKPDELEPTDEQREILLKAYDSEEDELSKEEFNLLRSIKLIEPIRDFSDRDLITAIKLIPDLPEERFPHMYEYKQLVDGYKGLAGFQESLIKVITRSSFPGIVERALEYAKENNNCNVIFGHTHRPFVIFDDATNAIIANAGGWVGPTDREIEIHNLSTMSTVADIEPYTFIKIKSKEISYCVFNDNNTISRRFVKKLT